jgi:penicillin-binding protein 2
MLNNFFRKNRILKGVEIEDSIMTITQKEKALIETPFQRRSLDIFWYLIVFLIILIFGRVFYLDIVRGAHYTELSRGNRIRSMTIKAPRGKILDKFGNVLVRNVPSIDVIIVPRGLPENPDERRAVAKKISSLLNLEEGNVEAAIESQDRKSFQAVLLQENITQEQALILAEKAQDLPGVALENTAIRSYENSLIFSSLIGYDGKITREELAKNPGYSMTDYIGKTGLEKYYENLLKGTNGARQAEVDAKGEIKKILGAIGPQAGQDIYLNIDEGLQKKIYDSLASALEKTQTRTAAAVAIDPRSGGVLALVSLPSYDNNLFAGGISNEEYKNLIADADLPLFNRAANGEYPPGSTLKPAVAAAALTEGTIKPETIIDGLGGTLHIGGFSFGDWKAHGPSDVRTAIAESNDIFFYTIGGGYGPIEGLGMDRMKKYENLFGFGTPTGIDLPEEASGFIPDEGWKQRRFGEKWYIGNSYHASIGQGYITATPIQLANYAAALANGGTLYSPKIVNRIKMADGREKKILPEIVRKDFLPDQVMRIVREGMKKTVTDGTAQPLKTLPVSVAGKTGTAQFGTEDKTHAWFISFAPFENPEIALAVLVEGGGESHSSAVPVTKEVYEWYFSQH